jgi:outer membrane protein
MRFHARIKLKQTLLATAFFIVQNACFATDLLEVYYEALENDPTFKKAYTAFMAESQSIPQAMAALLPQLSIEGLSTRTYTEVMAGANLDVNKTYGQTKFIVNASQSIFNMKLWSLLEQSRANVRASLANFNDQAQNLILRTSQSYFDILLAQDNLHTLEVQLKAQKRQLKQAQERFNVGLDPVTTVLQAKASYDQVYALLFGAKNNLIIAQQNLAKLTGQTYDSIAPLKQKSISLVYPEPSKPEAWITTSLKQNYKLNAAKYYLEASRQNIKLQASGHLPYFTLFGNFSQANNHIPSTGAAPPYANTFFNDIFVPQMQRNGNFGVQANLPIFQGGLVVAKTKEAEFQFQNYSNQLEYVKRDVVVNTQITFSNTINLIEKIKADRQTLISEKASLESIEAQYQAGTRTITDVLFAQQQYVQTQLQYNNDQYSLITQLLQLKYLAGSLNVKDLEEINSWLRTHQLYQLSPKSAAIFDFMRSHHAPSLMYTS